MPYVRAITETIDASREVAIFFMGTAKKIMVETMLPTRQAPRATL